MKNQITIREAITEADIAVFWGQLHTYHMRDIFPDSENENRKHFLDDTEYRAQIQRVHDRQQDRCEGISFPWAAWRTAVWRASPSWGGR